VGPSPATLAEAASTSPSGETSLTVSTPPSGSATFSRVEAVPVTERVLMEAMP
jgi:hypothetical protein